MIIIDKSQSCSSCLLTVDFIIIYFRGVLAVLTVWLEQFPYDFSDPPNYPDLTKILHFVEREVTESGKCELEKKIRTRIERFKITPFDDLGMA